MSKIMSEVQVADLVNKIKAKQNALTAGNGLKISNNTISLDPDDPIARLDRDSNDAIFISEQVGGNNITIDLNSKSAQNLVTVSDNLYGPYDLATTDYVSSAISSAISGITSFEYEVVQTLPATGEKGVIYLVPNSGSTRNIYDEYIWIAGASTGSWEKIGTTEIDLSNYYTKTEADALLDGKADTADIPTVNNATLTIQKNGTSVGTFTANSANDVTANITVPTAVSELTNDSGFLTTVPVASASTVGGIKVGSGLSIASDGTLTATGTSMVLYDTTGQNTDGAMTQKAVTDNLPVEFTTAEWNALWA